MARRFLIHQLVIQEVHYKITSTELVEGKNLVNIRYFPAAPVQCSINTGSAISNGGAEAYVELAKALNIMGDYRLSTACNITRWAYPPLIFGGNVGVGTRMLQNLDYGAFISNVFSDTGIPLILDTPGNAGGDLGSQCYTSAISLETSNGIEISGLNAEEQSDISFLCTWADKQNALNTSPTSLECYVYYDAMIILEENNVVKLIQ